MTFLKLYQEVNTDCGVGIIVSIVTPYNGLYVEYDRAKVIVWFGNKKAIFTGTQWISREYYLSQLEEWNKELKLDNILNDIGI